MTTMISNLPFGVTQRDIDRAFGGDQGPEPTFEQIANEMPDEADAACVEAIDGLDLVSSLLALADASDAVKHAKTIAELRSAELVLAARAANLGREARRIGDAVVSKLGPKYLDRIA